jgi:hypothetical protein
MFMVVHNNHVVAVVVVAFEVRIFSDVGQVCLVEDGDDHVVVGSRVLDVTNRFQIESLE